MPNPQETQRIQLTSDTWRKVLLAIVIHAATLLAFLYKLEMEKERRFSTLEANQKMLIKVVDRIESRVFSKESSP
jgi:hypothetical protein